MDDNNDLCLNENQFLCSLFSIANNMSFLMPIRSKFGKKEWIVDRLFENIVHYISFSSETKQPCFLTSHVQNDKSGFTVNESTRLIT